MSEHMDDGFGNGVETVSDTGDTPVGTMPTMTTTFEPLKSTPAQGSNKLMLGIAAAGLVLLAVGVGKMMFSGGGDAGPVRTHTPTRSVWSQQQEMMRESMQMAREAQRMQREHMARMERAMMDTEMGYGSGEMP